MAEFLDISDGNQLRQQFRYFIAAPDLSSQKESNSDLKSEVCREESESSSLLSVEFQVFGNVQVLLVQYELRCRIFTHYSTKENRKR